MAGYLIFSRMPNRPSGLPGKASIPPMNSLFGSYEFMPGTRCKLGGSSSLFCSRIRWSNVIETTHRLLVEFDHVVNRFHQIKIRIGAPGDSVAKRREARTGKEKENENRLTYEAPSYLQFDFRISQWKTEPRVARTGLLGLDGSLKSISNLIFHIFQRFVCFSLPTKPVIVVAIVIVRHGATTAGHTRVSAVSYSEPPILRPKSFGPL